MSDYMKTDAKLLPYLPFPRFLLGADLTQTAKLLYAVLLDRANLSRANGWTDEDGNIFIVFPLNKLADMVDKGSTTVKTALTELEAAGLIERRRCGNGMPNRIYVKQPDSQDIDRLMDRKPATRQPENRPSDSRKTDRQMAGKPAPNKISNSNLKNNLSGVSESARILGRYENVFLTEAEVAELQADFPTVWQEYIERLSEYMASTGKTYKSHAATIRRWVADDRRKSKGGISDYSCKEGESL
jgi:DNA-binding MarR family transcriptional regulator